MKRKKHTVIVKIETDIPIERDRIVDWVQAQLGFLYTGFDETDDGKQVTIKECESE